LAGTPLPSATNAGAVTWNLGTLTSSAGTSIAFTLVPSVTGTLTNTASAACSTTEVNLANNSIAAVTVVTKPSLKISRSAGNFLLSWTTNAVGYTLQTCPTLATNGLWAPVTNVVWVVGNQYVVTNPPIGLTRFYRLTH
jgi:hypothetical protein